MSAIAKQIEVKSTGTMFQPESVRAILEGRKTITRRVMKPQPETSHDGLIRFAETFGGFIAPHVWGGFIKCPYGDRGDLLWVRESWQPKNWDGDKYYMMAGCPDAAQHPTETYLDSPTRAIYRASYNESIGDPGPWRNPMFMPRWASRITLEITNVRVERLQEISLEGILAEGITVDTRDQYWREEALRKWQAGWDKLNAKRGYSWSNNPWVWLIEFKKVS